MISRDTQLWGFVSLRPEISGLHIDRPETLTNHIMPTKFAGPNLRYLELPAELITPQVRLCSLLISKCHRLNQEHHISELGHYIHHIDLENRIGKKVS